MERTLAVPKEFGFPFNMRLVFTCTFLVLSSYRVSSFAPQNPRSQLRHRGIVCLPSNEWQGEVVPNEGGKIRGCSIRQVGDSVTDWIIEIDGVEADLGRFSDAIYKKIISDAKKQRFQGFRPGTIPPHIEPTYRAFTMDECARETVLEAMEQNSLRPFTDARNEFLIEKISFPPPKSSKKKTKGRKKTDNVALTEETLQEEEEPKWLTFETMKEAIDAGWKPGQSFSFVASNVKGQKVLSNEDVQGSRPLGLNY